MDKINKTIKKLRKEKGFTQDSFADRLAMARATYTKIENGSTTLNYPTLLKISQTLDIPIAEIIKENGDPVFKEISDDLKEMLFWTSEAIDREHTSVVPYDELTPRHLALLKDKGFDSREEYEAPLLGGRIYKFGPRRRFEYMVENLGMNVLFKRNLIIDDFWLYCWNEYVKNKEKLKGKPWFPGDEHHEIEIDDQEYFDVYLFVLKFSGDKKEYFQMARRDFPKGTDEWGALEYAVIKMGALDGDIIGMCDSYSPCSEIIT